jgi:hypothetical protein
LGRFGSEFDEPAGFKDPLANGDPFSCRHNQRESDFLRQGRENTIATGVFGRLGGNSGISEVDFCCLAGNSVGVAGARSSGIVTAVGPMTAQEFWGGVKRDKAN